MLEPLSSQGTPNSNGVFHGFPIETTLFKESRPDFFLQIPIKWFKKLFRNRRKVAPATCSSPAGTHVCAHWQWQWASYEYSLWGNIQINTSIAMISGCFELFWNRAPEWSRWKWLYHICIMNCITKKHQSHQSLNWLNSKIRELPQLILVIQGLVRIFRRIQWVRPCEVGCRHRPSQSITTRHEPSGERRICGFVDLRIGKSIGESSRKNHGLFCRVFNDVFHKNGRTLEAGHQSPPRNPKSVPWKVLNRNSSRFPVVYLRIESEQQERGMYVYWGLPFLSDTKPWNLWVL